jgi:hypothetical protein
MNKFLQLCNVLDLQLTPEQYFAGLFLETQGKRFCVDFGYDNAVQMAESYIGYFYPRYLM